MLPGVSGGLPAAEERHCHDDTEPSEQGQQAEVQPRARQLTLRLLLLSGGRAFAAGYLLLILSLRRLCDFRPTWAAALASLAEHTALV